MWRKNFETVRIRQGEGQDSQEARLVLSLYYALLLQDMFETTAAKDVYDHLEVSSMTLQQVAERFKHTEIRGSHDTRDGSDSTVRPSTPIYKND